MPARFASVRRLSFMRSAQRQKRAKARCPVRALFVTE